MSCGRRSCHGIAYQVAATRRFPASWGRFHASWDRSPVLLVLALAVGSGCDSRVQSEDARPAPDIPAPPPTGADGFLFEDATEPSGVSVLDSAGGFGHGVAAADFDNDGWTDIYVVLYQASNALLHNNGDGTFTNVAEQAGVLGGPRVADRGTAPADYDGDGDVDLYIASAHNAPNSLFRNNGDGTFTDVAESAGLVNLDQQGQGVSWGDYDGDLDLDLFLPSYEQQNRLFRHDEGGAFTNVTAEAGLGDFGSSVQGVFFDIEHDGDLDIFVSRGETILPLPVLEHVGQPLSNLLYINQGHGVLLEQAAAHGLADAGPHGQGVAVGDYDGDGDSDLFMAATFQDGRLYRNDQGRYAEVGSQAGPFPDHRSHGPHFADFNNDGRLDLYLVNFGPNRLLRNDGDGTFSDVTETSGVGDRRRGWGSVVVDYDRDGRLDIFFSNSGEPSALLRNVGPAGHWLRITLDSHTPNRQGIGARVMVDSGGHQQMQQLVSGSAMCSGGGELALHFGLGNSQRADRIEVFWPSGTRDVLLDIPVDQTLSIREGAHGETAEGSGALPRSTQ